jgi:hypothetical protein
MNSYRVKQIRDAIRTFVRYYSNGYSEEKITEIVDYTLSYKRNLHGKKAYTIFSLDNAYTYFYAQLINRYSNLDTEERREYYGKTSYYSRVYPSVRLGKKPTSITEYEYDEILASSDYKMIKQNKYTTKLQDRILFDPPGENNMCVFYGLLNLFTLCPCTSSYDSFKMMKYVYNDMFPGGMEMDTFVSFVDNHQDYLRIVEYSDLDIYKNNKRLFTHKFPTQHVVVIEQDKTHGHVMFLPVTKSKILKKY